MPERTVLRHRPPGRRARQRFPYGRPSVYRPPGPASPRSARRPFGPFSSGPALYLGPRGAAQPDRRLLPVGRLDHKFQLRLILALAERHPLRLVDDVRQLVRRIPAHLDLDRIGLAAFAIGADADQRQFARLHPLAAFDRGDPVLMLHAEGVEKIPPAACRYLTLLHGKPPSVAAQEDVPHGTAVTTFNALGGLGLEPGTPGQLAEVPRQRRYCSVARREMSGTPAAPLTSLHHRIKMEL